MSGSRVRGSYGAGAAGRSVPEERSWSQELRERRKQRLESGKWKAAPRAGGELEGTGLGEESGEQRRASSEGWGSSS